MFNFMRIWREDEKKRNINHKNGRINIIIAIIFLLGGSILYRLYDLQVEKYDLYITLASSQHQVFSELEPERGKIFISGYKEGLGKGELYPFASNKDFALVYAIPKEIREAEEVAEKLYIIFKQEEVEEEVEKLLAEQAQEELNKELEFVASLGLSAEIRQVKETEVRQRHGTLKFNKEHQEFLAIKREVEIKMRKDKIIGEYLSTLTKKNDPYEPIKKKVEEEVLKKLYSLLLSNENEEIGVNDLEIKNNDIYKRKINGELEKIEFPGISYTMIMYRFYPEGSIGSHVLGFVSSDIEEQRGKYGLEGFFDEELFGQFGSIKTERSADRNIIIVNDREYVKPVKGDDLILTINRSVQFAACQKLNETAMRHGADGGSVIIMEVETGAIIAMCSWPDFDPNNYEDVEDIKVFNNPAIFSQYEPGSVFKAITMAAALDQGKITPETIYNDEGKVMVAGWPKPIKNSDYDTYGGHGEVNMNYVLEYSLNTGAIFAMNQVGSKIFADYVKNFGFGEKTGIELSAESPGDIRNLIGKRITQINASVASYGQGITVTALQMLMSYATIANGGILMKPYIVKEIIHDDGTKDITQPRQIRRVISQKTAVLLGGMLVNVVEGGHAKGAGVKGYYVAGKTGTAQVASAVVRGYGGKTIHTFVGFAPVDEPKFVMLIKLDDPKDVRYAASSAAPLFGEIAEFLLNYYQIPKERD